MIGLAGLSDRAHADSSSAFTFAAAGDIGTPYSGAAAASISYLESANPAFFLALGDLSYDPSNTGETWCSQFKANYNKVLIVPGAHDTGEFPPGEPSTTRSYEKFVKACPFPLAVPLNCNPALAGNCTGKEYYFDYPAATPIARFILISPGIFNITGTCEGPPFGNCIIPQPGLSCNNLSQNATQNAHLQEYYDCWPYSNSPTDAHYTWVANTIDNARAQGIRWIIVGMHKPCISAGKENCSIGPDIFNLLLSKHVDLILQATDHAYERSYPLGLNPTTCRSIPYLLQPTANQSSTFVSYNPNCIIQNYGSQGYYLPHIGTTVILQGTMGGGLNEVNEDGTIVRNDTAPERPYFSSGLMGANTLGNGHGFVEYTVTTTAINIQTVFTGTFEDSFTISDPPVPSFTWSPRNASIGLPINFTGFATGDSTTYSYHWDFGDGTTADLTAGDSSTVPHTFNRMQQYVLVTLTVTGSTGANAVQREVFFGSWNPIVQCSPILTSIENVVGPVPTQRIASNPDSIGADYTGGGFQLQPNIRYNSTLIDWPFSKRAVNLPPPCQVRLPSGKMIPTFLELRNVTVTTVSVSGCSNYYDVYNGGGAYPQNWQSCVTGFNLKSSNSTKCPECFHTLYSTIDRDWNASGAAPYPAPVSGARIDVQGFIYWEYSSVTAPWHSYSGWELIVTGWRNSTSTLSQNPPAKVSRPSSMLASAGPIVTIGLSFLGTLAIGIFLKRKVLSSSTPTKAISRKRELDDKLLNIKTESIAEPKQKQNRLMRTP